MRASGARVNRNRSRQVCTTGDRELPAQLGHATVVSNNMCGLTFSRSSSIAGFSVRLGMQRWLLQVIPNGSWADEQSKRIQGFQSIGTSILTVRTASNLGTCVAGCTNLSYTAYRAAHTLQHLRTTYKPENCAGMIHRLFSTYGGTQHGAHMPSFRQHAAAWMTLKWRGCTSPKRARRAMCRRSKSACSSESNTSAASPSMSAVLASDVDHAIPVVWGAADIVQLLTIALSLLFNLRMQ